MHSPIDQLDLPTEIRGVVRDGPNGSRPPFAKHGKSSIVRGLFREPLLHFLIAGGLLFALGTLFDRSTTTGSNRNQIKVSEPEIQRLSDVFARQSGHPPDPIQIKNLIDDYIRQEVLYREALASSLDKDDTIIRRRLIEKMEFLSQELAAEDPSEIDLQRYFQQNREKFQASAQIAFSHIYFSTAKRGLAAEGDASHLLASLKSGQISLARLSDFGDPFMLQNEYPLQTEQQIKELFGGEFAGKLFQLDSGNWAGPIRSSYGFHLVLISQKLPTRIPELFEVRNQVLTDFKNHRLQVVSEAFYERLRKRYRVEVDKSALSKAATQQSTPIRSGSQPVDAPDLD